MGCTQGNQNDIANNDNSKNKNNKQNGDNNNNNNNNNANDPLNANQPPPPSNPYIALTNKELYNLKASWKGIKRSMEETGVLIFVK